MNNMLYNNQTPLSSTEQTWLFILVFLTNSLAVFAPILVICDILEKILNCFCIRKIRRKKYNKITFFWGSSYHSKGN